MDNCVLRRTHAGSGRLAWPLAAALVLVLACPATLAAQDSRQEELAKKQAEKAANLQPYKKEAGERIIDFAEEVLAGTRPVYPWLGSIYPGGLFGAGVGFQHAIGDTGRANALAGISLRSYKLLDAAVKLPEFAGRHVAVTTHARWLDAPTVAFYGIGAESRPEDRSTYAYRPGTLGLTATLQAAKWLSLGAGGDYISVSAAPSGGLADRFPHLAAAPLLDDVTYVVGRAAARIDWRQSPGYSRSGGLYRVDWSRHDDRDGAGLSFQQTEAEVVQLIPLLRANWVLAFRGLVTTTDTSDGNAVPVFMLPSLGGGSTLRGYPSWRFRDRHRLLLSGEYRWTPGQLVDMALFVDAGKVAAERRDLDLNGLKRDYGIGVRIHGPTFNALKLEVARGDEGWAFNIGGQTAF